jgi:methyl-accepting chemotaxis protein
MVPLAKEDLGHPIFIRLQQSPEPTGIRRALRIGERSDHVTRLMSGAIPSFMVSGILLLLGIITLVGFFIRQRDVYLFFCGLFSFCAATLVIGISEGQNLLLAAPAFWANATIVAALFMGPALAAFIATAIIKEQRPALTIAVRTLFGLAGLMAVGCLSDATFLQRHIGLFVACIIGALLVSMVVGVQETIRGNVDARVFSLGVGSFFAVVFFDSMSVLGLVSTSGFHTYLGLLGLTLALALVVVRRFLQIQTSLEGHMKERETRHAAMARLSSRLADSARVLVGAVGRLRQSSDVQNDVVDRQAATLQEILATAQEINQASRIAAERATAIMGSAAQADEANQSVGHAVEEGLGGISAMGSEVAQMAARIRALEPRTRQISGIVDTVKDLADQSNMLALNAAIEAVRSGESGKGFVVVAREMRSLADLSLQATHRIREVLVSVNDGIREAADLSERSEGRIQASLQQLQGSGQQLRTLSQIVHDSNGNVRQISAAIGQQSAGVSQVFAALNDLSRQMTQTVERLKETREATASVEKVADVMSEALADTSIPAEPEMRPIPVLEAA